MYYKKAQQRVKRQQYLLNRIRKITLTAKELSKLTKPALKKLLRKAGICLSRDYTREDNHLANSTTFSQNKLA